MNNFRPILDANEPTTAMWTPAVQTLSKFVSGIDWCKVEYVSMVSAEGRGRRHFACDEWNEFANIRADAQAVA